MGLDKTNVLVVMCIIGVLAMLALSLLSFKIESPNEKLCQLYEGDYLYDFSVNECQYTVCQRSSFDGLTYADRNVWYKHGKGC